MKLRFLLLSLIILVVTAACAPPPVLRDDGFLKDNSLLTGEPCEAPCWRGITPGETNWSDAVTIVEDDPQLANIETVRDDQSEARLINFTDTDGPQCCRVISEDGESVSAILTLLAPQMTLGEVIEKYGEPDYFTGGDVTPDQTLLSVVFEDVPLVIYVFGAGTENGTISADSEVIGSIYVTSDGMQELVQSTSLYNWEGYGPLAGMLDENFDLAPELDADGNPIIEDITDVSSEEEPADAEAETENE